MATRQGARGAAKAQIRARITRAGSECRKDVTSGTCKLCITEACTRASEMVERLDGSYIHDDDWDEEKFVLQPWHIAGDSDEG